MTRLSVRASILALFQLLGLFGAVFLDGGARVGLAGFGALATLLSIALLRKTMSRVEVLTTSCAAVIQGGDLTRTFESEYDDEVGRLAGTLQQMVAWLREVPSLMQLSAQNLAAAAAEICAAAQEQEAAAQQQASAVHEVSATTMSLLDSAGHISDTAGGVLSNAEKTKGASELIAKKITELSGHTGRMSEILEVIRDIADRSDLLALNASLEGTRAGEAGRGFSLVAGEMRRLAERVTASVHSVKELVSDVRGSGSSTMIVTEEARKLAESTTESARQITRVTDQQRSSTEQVAQSMKEISAVLTQSVTASRQTLSSSEALKNQAQQLLSITRQFRLDGAGRA
jgi:methyl-accepting chemotaxis protein